MDENELSYRMIGLAIEVHSELGPGLLESVYKECLYYRICKEGFYAEKEKPLPVVYEGVRLECGFKIDILVEKKLLLETKSVETLHAIFFAKTLTYLRLSHLKLGLIMNFNSIRMKDGIKRVINGVL